MTSCNVLLLEIEPTSSRILDIDSSALVSCFPQALSTISHRWMMRLKMVSIAYDSFRSSCGYEVMTSEWDHGILRQIRYIRKIKGDVER